MLLLMTIIVNGANIHMLLCNDFAKRESTVRAKMLNVIVLVVKLVVNEVIMMIQWS